MVRNNTLYDLTLLKFAQTYFVTIIQSILENVPCAPEMNVYSASVGWNVLLDMFGFVYGSSPVFLTSPVFVWMISSLLKVGCLSPLLLLDCCICPPFRYVNICLIYLGALILHV